MSILTHREAFAGFDDLNHALVTDFYFNGNPVDTGHWQAMKDVPMTKTIELTNVVIGYPIPNTQIALADDVKPSTPWAELQFRERVAGEPVNPGDTYKLWPWYRGNVEKHQTVEEVQFSHTYMERFWPKIANAIPLIKNASADHPDQVFKVHHGIRYRYGDLNDVLDLLAREPHTRQAYLPIWFPEDTGAHHGERVPCTLGYHLLLRDGKLNITYFIRSCDFYRHFRDDVYMAARLAQWVVEQLRDRDEHPDQQWDTHLSWDDVHPGNLVMHMDSLHIFEGDLPRLERDLNGR